jgi:hypothetical protein
MKPVARARATAEQKLHPDLGLLTLARSRYHDGVFVSEWILLFETMDKPGLDRSLA